MLEMTETHKDVWWYDCSTSLGKRQLKWWNPENSQRER